MTCLSAFSEAGQNHSSNMQLQDTPKLPGLWLTNRCQNFTMDNKEQSFKADRLYSETYKKVGIVKENFYHYNEPDCKGEGKLDTAFSNTEKFTYGNFNDDGTIDIDMVGWDMDDGTPTYKYYTRIKIEEKDGKLVLREAYSTGENDGSTPEKRRVQLEEEPSFEKK